MNDDPHRFTGQAECANCGRQVDTSDWHPAALADGESGGTLLAFCSEGCRAAWKRVSGDGRRSTADERPSHVETLPRELLTGALDTDESERIVENLVASLEKSEDRDVRYHLRQALQLMLVSPPGENS
ncbi:MAG: hypothetical protein ABEJ06_05080 [Haloarculaceae archaeon]